MRTGTEERSSPVGTRPEGCLAGAPALSPLRFLTGGTGGHRASGERQNSAGRAAQLEDLVLRFQVTSTRLCSTGAAQGSSCRHETSNRSRGAYVAAVAVELLGIP